MHFFPLYYINIGENPEIHNGVLFTHLNCFFGLPVFLLCSVTIFRMPLYTETTSDVQFALVYLPEFLQYIHEFAIISSIDFSNLFASLITAWITCFLIYYLCVYKKLFDFSIIIYNCLWRIRELEFMTYTETPKFIYIICFHFNFILFS